jgi:protein-tyrosine phosphatase
MTDLKEKTSVLFVCMGNICRSPTAEGVFRHAVAGANLEDQIRIDSAGTHAYHTGSPADRRASAAAERRGYSLTDIHARPVEDSDFDEFDFIIAMDLENVAALQSRAAEIQHAKIRLMLDFSSGPEREVPDPYYGGSAGFERVLDLVEDASRGLLETLSKQLR